MVVFVAIFIACSNLYIEHYTIDLSVTYIVALQLLSTRRCIVAYWPNLRSVVRYFVSMTTDDAAVLAPAAARSRDFVGGVIIDATKSSSSGKSVSWTGSNDSGFIELYV